MGFWNVVADGGFPGAPDLTEVRRALEILLDDEKPHELRSLPSARSRLVSRANPDEALAIVGELADERGLYFTLNPIDGSPSSGRAAKDTDIARRRWLLIDVDPIKAEADESSTEEEKEVARLLAWSTVDDLSERGWPSPVVVDSGNGFHLLYRLDLPNDADSRKLVASVLKALAKQHDGPGARIDTKVSNAARISKLPGTWSRKGTSTPERPHRLCRIILAPETPEIVPAEWLEEVAGGPADAATPSQPYDPWTVKATNGTGHGAYVRSAVERELSRVALAPIGDRNTFLNRAAFNLGTLLESGEVGQEELTSQLLLAATRAGLGEHEARATIRSGLQAGAANPRTLPERNGSLNGKAHAAPREGDAWGEPVLDEAVPAAAFPIEVFPSGLADFVLEAAECLACPVDYLGVSCLVVASGAIGRSVAIGLKEGWAESPALYAAVVGDPGMTKSPAIGQASRPLWKITEDLIRRHKAAAAEAKKGNEPPPPMPRLAVDDTTVEALAPILQDNPRGLIMVRDELTAWVSGLNQYKSGGKGADRQFFLSAWSGSPVVVDRKRNEGVPIHIPHPFLSVLGALTPGMLTELSEAKNRDDGFLDRLLFALPEPVRVRWRTQGLNSGLLLDWEMAIRRLWSRPMTPSGDGRLRPYLIPLSSEASDRFGCWFDDHCLETEQADFPAYLKGPWAKLRAYCGRLALVVEMLRVAYEGADDLARIPEIDVTSVADAIGLIDYFKCHARRVRALLRGAGEDNDDARAILAWILKTERHAFSERDVRQNFRARFAGDNKALTSAIEWLKTRRCVRPRETCPSGKPGRPPSPSYDVNPALFAAEESRLVASTAEAF